MATIRKRGSAWQVQIRRKGWQDRSRTFATKRDAELWASRIDAECLQGPPDPSSGESNSIKVRDLIERYIETVAPRKRSGANELTSLRAFLRQEWAELAIAEITPAHLSAYRDQRLERVRPATVLRELGILRHLFGIAIAEWGVPLRANPLCKLKNPRADPGRTRRLEVGEWQRLESALASCRNNTVPLAVRFALATAMRRSEILALRWKDVDLTRRIAQLHMTKNGQPRCVPLSSEAVLVLKAARGATSEQRDRVFATTAEAIKLSWQRATKRASLDDLRFHDLRHEAISRFFEKGLSLPEVALISGHKDPRMLFRYTHLKAESLVQRLG